MCLSGSAAKVIGMPADYSNMFGIGIGLDFNNSGSGKQPYDATMHGVVAFSFTIAGVPAGGIRVEFAEPATDASGDSYSKTITADGSYTIHLNTTDLKPSFAPPMGMEPAFDASKLESIQFHIPTTTSAAIPVTNMCVSKLAAIKM
jgi:hypothetical protein